MTKVNYFQVSLAGQDDQILYGHSQKHIKDMCGQESLDWEEVTELKFQDLEKDRTDKELYEIRIRSKEIWNKMEPEDGKE
jgi:hypothetical protein